MKYIIPFLFSISLIVSACKHTATEQEINEIKATIIKTEKDFETATKDKGIQEAFYEFADSNAIIKREDDRLIKGKEQIKIYYQSPSYKNNIVKWKPDFVGLSDDGTLAYTYGIFTWTIQDSNGKPIEYKGVFHTVWKKQKDGSWKYVWD